MTNIQKEYIKSNHKWPFEWQQIFTKYFILIAPIGITIVAISMLYGGFKFGHIYENNFLNAFALTSLAGFIIGFCFTYFILSRIKIEKQFKEMTLGNSLEFENLNNKIKPLNWTLIEEDADSVVFSTESSAFSWGETVSIVKLNDKKILINTRPFGDTQPFTLKQDKVNYKKLSGIIK